MTSGRVRPCASTSRTPIRPRLEIWRVGTGGAAPAGYTPPAGDHHLEYVADEYLSLTYGAGLDEPLEVRRAGRTGTYGWTTREGYPSID